MFKALAAHVGTMLGVVAVGYMFNQALEGALGVIRIPSFVILFVALFSLSMQVYNAPKIQKLYEDAKRNKGVGM